MKDALECQSKALEQYVAFDLEKLECITCDGSFGSKIAFAHHMKQFHATEV